MHPVGLCTRTLMCGEKDTDTAGPTASQTGLPRALCMFALPRVHAADVADPQTSLQSLPKHVGKPEFPDTGWDRLKDLFNRGSVSLHSFCPSYYTKLFFLLTCSYLC